jgi:nucleotide-binding universal stress UspA family protein
LRSILVVLDASDEASPATELGLRWAQQYHASLVGLGVVDEPTICRPEPLPIGGSYFKAHRNAVLLEDARCGVHEMLSRFERRCVEAAVPCTLLERTGRPEDHAALEAQRCDVMLIGRRDSLDRTLVKTLRQSPRPVVVVPPPASGTGPVVIVYDGSAPAARTLYAFQASALDTGSGVYLLSVEADGKAGVGADRAVDFLQSHNITARRETLPRAPAETNATAILQVVRRVDARLLVLGTEDQPTLRRFFKGSLVNAMLTHSHVPLFWFS